MQNNRQKNIESANNIDFEKQYWFWERNNNVLQ